ncbi:hypothetical protein DPMN_114725 [Dreissena polymorpha]|uniref:Uncharacterized protein n=1 Tax=Dreissena polymorpha TaxID=45954 RepID=A0A9D4KKG0_DREPO|nr:hypothetical protein DPMN_114725 [Dreissena polymorpha]
MPGYRPPEPQLLTIDDIRSPIPWYQDDEEERDEFNWTQVEEDLLEFEDGKTIVSYRTYTVF